ncbi:hypothetical protein WH47_11807 [Habropoda laboriosa]|uniref:Uncharacterized protein n=1 Tax=Habropoda laboriosa TaxID=597456 RepID=A0A0L7R8F2_9HYME|nr:hypothetical protein WH47_11807 [Habropoda laboriosa]
MLATRCCLSEKSSRSRGKYSYRRCSSFADERQEEEEEESEIASDVSSRWRDFERERERERRAAITGNHTVDMIISKDLFLFGDQDYLRLPSNEKRQQRAMGRPIINAPR